jgi:acyl-coenzyme A thioesterase PaaI-like protein
VFFVVRNIFKGVLIKRLDIVLKLINFYPPFLGAGIRVNIAPDFRTVQVKMSLRWYNLNAVGTHFGGSLYAMCDPWFMLMLIKALGDGYIIWDKAATIRFLKPGRGTVRATFQLSQETIDSLRTRADAGEKLEPTFTADVCDEQGELVAQVDKLLYIRKKRAENGK